MKLPALLLGSILLAVAAVTPCRAARAPNYHVTAIELVTECFRRENKKPDDETWKKFLADQNVGGAKFTEACNEVRAVAEALVADGTVPDSPHFARILRATFEVPVIAAAAAPAPATTPAGAPATMKTPAAPETSAAPDDSDLQGDYVVAVASLRIDEKRLQQELAAHDTQLAALAPGSEGRANRERDRAATFFSLTLTRARIAQEKAANVVAVAQAAYEKAKANPDTPADDLKKKEQAVAEAKAKKANADQQKEKLADTGHQEALSRLRRLGITVNAGYGYFTKLGRYEPTVQVKYAFVSKQLRDGPRADWVAALEDNAKVTSICGWIGYTANPVTSKRLNSSGQFDRENPLLVGASVGFGHNTEAASIINLDVGAAFFNKDTFRKKDWYVGVSVDAVIFPELLKALGDAAVGK